MMVQEEELNGAGLVVPGAGGAAKSIINVLEGGFYKNMHCCCPLVLVSPFSLVMLSEIWMWSYMFKYHLRFWG